MTDVATDPRPAFAVIPDVEICHVGENWPVMADGTEDGTFTPEDLAAAVAAQDDPSVRTPVIKFGHTAAAAGKLTLGDAAPVWGRATNLRLADEGMTLVADFEGVPVWLAEILPSAYPSRSIEAKRNTMSDIGHTHDLVITGVALLGVELPAISTLADVQAVWSARTPTEARVTLKEESVPTKATRKATNVAAATTTEDIRRAYYDSLPSGSYWWIREMSLDPLMLIVEADDGDLFQVPVTVSGNDITFGTPVEVRVEYTPVDDGAPTSASRRRDAPIVFANRNESRKGVAGVDAVELRKSLGLAEDASDEDVTARIAELAARPEPKADDAPPAPKDDAPPAPPAPTPPAPTGDAPAGTVLVDAVQWAEVQRQAAEGALAAKRMREDERGRFIGEVVAAGRLSRANTELRASLEREWNRDPETARKVAAGLAKVVHTDPTGVDDAPEGDEDDALYKSLFGTEGS